MFTMNITSAINVLLLCLFLFPVSPSLSASNGVPGTGFFNLPVKVDPTTHQYYTSIGIGTPRHNTNLAIDLEGKFLWYDCDTHYNSSSYNPVTCDSPKCPQASPCIGCNGFPTKPGCTNNTCGLDVVNPFADAIFSGDMGEDLLFLPQMKVPRAFVSGCTDSDRFTSPLLVGLPKGIKGILGLARTRLALPNQVSSLLNTAPKFTLCLPSYNSKTKTGQLFIGGKPSSSITLSRTGFSSSSDEYFIHVKSINIDEKPVKFKSSLLSVDGKGNGGTKISTMSPYTVLHPSIYKPFVKDFVKAANSRKIERVKSVHPFGACFNGNSIAEKEGLPSIKLAMDGPNGNVNYEILAHNSLVEAKKGVLCLAFVDGGREAKSGVVLGGYQMEDRIVEFDLSTSILSFSSCLLLHNASCSDPASLSAPIIN